MTTELGVSHQAIDDIALMRALPNMAVIEPCGCEQIAAAVRASLDYDGPVYLRLQVTRGPADPEVPLASMQLGRGIILREGTDGAIVACGIMVKEALTAADSLATKGVSITVANMPSLKPLDSALVHDLARHHPLIVSAENHSLIGGLGAAIAETLALGASRCRFGMIGVQDTFAEGGSKAFLMQRYGLTAAHIVAKIEELRGR